MAPAYFYGTDLVQRADFWVPEGIYRLVLADLPRSVWDNRRVLGFAAVGRLRAGMSLDQAQAALTSLAGQLAREHPNANRRRGVALVPLDQALISPNNRQTYVRAGGLVATMVGLILLIACANLANLLLVRAAGRRREIAIRIALGGRRSDLIRQLLLESLFLALAAGAAGLLLASWSLTLISRVQTPYLPDSPELGLDGRVLLFTFALSLGTARCSSGLVPALAASRPDHAGAPRTRPPRFPAARRAGASAACAIS